MGRDKAGIERPGGIRQIDHLVNLARQFEADPMISTNDSDVAPPGVKSLADLEPGSGPLGALQTFHARYPDEAVLVLSCDLFLLDLQTIEQLRDAHHPDSLATCFLNRVDGRPEPLCAIYEPAALAHVGDALASDRRCARHFLESLEPSTLTPSNPVALDNANSPADLAEAFSKITDGIFAKEITVLYFAKLREARGLDEERISTLANTGAGLYEDLRFKHRLPLDLASLRLARNGDFCDWSVRLRDGDEIVFIPPVAGG